MAADSSLDHDHPVDAERVAHARSRLLPAEDAARLASLLSLLAHCLRQLVERSKVAAAREDG
ncbi:MAG: hypothetical protein JWN46_2350 [Acidimicrobiales bacterium]|nr:hypothetical protein [Acidimicrobiales bacterium]